MRTRLTLVLAMAALLAGCNEGRLITARVAQIKVHDIRMGVERTITKRGDIRKIRAFLDQPAAWTTNGVTPQIVFLTIAFCDSHANELLRVRGTGLDLWAGPLHRSLTEAEYRTLFSLLSGPATDSVQPPLPGEHRP